MEKELCVTQLVNPHVTQQGLVVKYCKRDKKQYSSSSYLPPPPPPPPNIDYGQVHADTTGWGKGFVNNVLIVPPPFLGGIAASNQP